MLSSGLTLRLSPLLRPHVLRRPARRLFSTPSNPNTPPNPPKPNPNTSSDADAARISRLCRLNSRLPRFLQHITTPLLSAPVSHVTSFLILHELTAIIPLVGLAVTFHYTNYLPPWFSEGKWVSDGVQKF